MKYVYLFYRPRHSFKGVTAFITAPWIAPVTIKLKCSITAAAHALVSKYAVCPIVKNNVLSRANVLASNFYSCYGHAISSPLF
jgi:hypothetical protein